MSMLKPELVRNADFDFWTGTAPDDYTITQSNGSVVQLDRHMARDHPARLVFPRLLKAEDLVQRGNFAHRAVQTSSSAAGDFLIATTALAVRGGMRGSLVIDHRSDLQLEVRVRVSNAAAAAIADLDRSGPGPDVVSLNKTDHWTWLVSAGFLPIADSTQPAGNELWLTTGIELPAMPAAADSLIVSIQNVDAGAGTIDLGRISVVGQLSRHQATPEVSVYAGS